MTKEKYIAIDDEASRNLITEYCGSDVADFSMA